MTYKYGLPCVQCGQYVIAENMVRWNGKLYGKGCFAKHIAPALKAKKLAGEEFYKVAERTLIEMIANTTVANPNYFTNSLQDQAKSFLSHKQQVSFFDNLTFEERVEFLSSYVNLFDIEKAAELNQNGNIHANILKILGSDVYTKKELEQMKKLVDAAPDREAHKKITKIKKRVVQQAMLSLQDLYTSNENFKKCINERYNYRNGICNLIELMIDSNVFRLFNRKLEDRLEELYSA